jgi:hypothetical protein
MTSLVMTGKEKSVYKGTENDDFVRRPDRLVKHLKAKGLLPVTAYVDTPYLPGLKMKRSALFGVKFADLAKRQQAIETYVDQSAIEDPNGVGISPLVGRQTVSLLCQMMAHAHVARPENIQTDALLMGLCQAIQNPAIYKGLTEGASDGFSCFIKTIEGSN